MRVRSGLALLICLLSTTMLAGCAGKAPLRRLTMRQLVDRYNANADRIPRLKAMAKIRITLPNGWSWGSTHPLAEANGTLLLGKTDDPSGPQNFVLIGRETLAVDVFRIGSSAAEEKYYLSYSFGDRGEAWWGWHKYAGAPGVESMGVDPNQLASVLSVCRLPDKFTSLPAVALSMTHLPGQQLRSGECCAYVLTYIDRQAITERIVFKREIFFNWDENGPPRPFLMKLFDGEGQRVMVARLKNYRPIRNDPPSRVPPVMPTNIEITWPGGGGKVHIVLSDMTTEDIWDIEACRVRIHTRLDPDHIIQVDRALEPGGPGR